MEVVVAKANLNGVLRDPKTGIVIARKHRHPLADLFIDAPMGQGLPGMHMAAEAEHILAIHVFDNLDCSPPRNPLYKARLDQDSMAATGQKRYIYVPINEPDDGNDVVEEAVEVDDISHYDDDQLAAMKVQIHQIEVRKKLLEQADPLPGDTP